MVYNQTKLYMTTGVSMDLNEYQQAARETAIYSQQYIVTYPALGLAGEAGEVCEKIKKMLRDDNGVLTDERKAMLEKELGDVAWYLANLASDLGLNLDDIFSNNIKKLQSRKERGVLKGDGDDR